MPRSTQGMAGFSLPRRGPVTYLLRLDAVLPLLRYRPQRLSVELLSLFGVNRRALLGLCGTLGASSTVGCLEPFPYFDSRLVIGWLALANRTGQRRRLGVRVERSGTVVHESVHEMEADSRTVLECPWGDVEEQYTISGRLPDEQWRSFDVEGEFERLPDCAVVTLEAFDGERLDGPPEWDIFARASCDQIGEGFPGGCSDTESASTTGTPSTVPE